VAGVSLSTASKALNGSTRISAATRARIEAAASRLDFRPNALAQSFASGRSRTIGIFTHRATSTFAQPVLIGAVRELGARERAVILCDADQTDAHWSTDDVRQLQARRVDGVLVIGDGHERTTRSLTERFQAPVAYAFTESDSPEDTVFLPDNEGAGRLATEHLVSVGRRRIAHITGAAIGLAAQLREAGMRSVLSEAGIEPAAPAQHGSWYPQWGEEATNRLVTDGVEFDALFCGNDHIALGAMAALQQHGVRVPDDVALVGVDNWEGIVVDQGTRRLTSVDLRLSRLGAVAASHLVEDESAGQESAASLRLDDRGRRLVLAELLVGPSTTS
jgi:LacI family transcriptional regulator